MQGIEADKIPEPAPLPKENSAPPPEDKAKKPLAGNEVTAPPQIQTAQPSTPLIEATRGNESPNQSTGPPPGPQASGKSLQLAAAVAVICVVLLVLALSVSSTSQQNRAEAVAMHENDERSPASWGPPNLPAPAPDTRAKTPLPPPLVEAPVEKPPQANAVNFADERKKQAEVKLQSARRHYQEGKYPEAATDYREVIALDPNNAETWCSLGWSLLKMNSPSDAIEAFQKAVSLKPTLANGWHGLAKAYVSTANAPEAYQALQHLQRIDADASAAVLREVDGDFGQRLAVLEFPDLGVLDSPFNIDFRNRYGAYQRQNPKYFNRRDWALRLAHETARALKLKPTLKLSR